MIALGKVRDDHVADLVTQALVPRFREEPISPLLGTTLMEVLRDDLHHGAGRPRGRRAAQLAGRQPRDVHPGAGGAGAVVGAAQAQRRGHLTAARRRRSRGSRTSATTRTTAPARRWTRCSASSPTTCSTTRRRQRRTEALKERLLEHPQVVTTAISLWKAMRSALLGSIQRPRGGRAPAAAGRAERVRRAAARRRRAARAPRPDGRRPHRLRGRALRRRGDHGDHPRRSSAGTARRRHGASSCTSVATCSSSGSTAPSSVAWSAC